MDRKTQSAFLDLIEEAPDTGAEYVRKNKAWAIGSGGLENTLTLPVAGGRTVTAGRAVEFIQGDLATQTNASLNNVQGTNDAYYHQMVRADSNSALCCWYQASSNKGEAALVTFNGTSAVTLSTIKDLTTSALMYPMSLDAASSTEFLYASVATGWAGNLSIITTAGTNQPTESSRSSLGTLASIGLNEIAVCCLTSANYLVSYIDSNSDCQVRYATSNGTNGPTLGTAANFNGTNNCSWVKMKALGTTDAMLVMRSSTESLSYATRVLSSGTNQPTFSQALTLNNGSDALSLDIAKIDSTRMLCAFRDSSINKVKLCVLTADGTNKPISGPITTTTITATSNTVSLSSNTSNRFTVTTEAGSSIIELDASLAIRYSKVEPFSLVQAYQGAVAGLSETRSLYSLVNSSNDGYLGALTLSSINQPGVADISMNYVVEAPTISSLLTLDGTNNITYSELSPLTSNSVVAEWSTGLVNKFSIITTGNPPMLGNVLTVAGSGYRHIMSKLDNTHIAVLGSDGTNGRVGILDATSTNSLSMSTFNTSFTVGSTSSLATCALTSSNWFVAYADTNSLVRVRNCLSNSTNAPILSNDSGTLSSSATSNISITTTTTNTGMLVWNESGGSYIYSVTSAGSNNPNVSSKGTLDNTNNCTYITQSPIDPSHTLCAYNNATTSNGCLAVIQANGNGAPTVISRAIFESYSNVYGVSLTDNSNNTFTLAYSTVNVTGGYTRTVTLDNSYNISMSKENKYYTINNATYTSVQSLNGTQNIVAFQGNGSDGFAGSLTLTPTPQITGTTLGIALSGGIGTNTCSVAIGPIHTDTNYNIAIGADYYVQGDNSIGTTVSPVHIGVGESSNALLLDMRGAPEAGKQIAWEIANAGSAIWTAPYTGEYRIVAVGGGGSGSLGGGLPRAVGGNAGNYVEKKIKIKQCTSLFLTIGTGGSAQTNTNTSGNNGTASSFVIGQLTFTASGGKGGITVPNASTVGQVNPLNEMVMTSGDEKLGFCGMSCTESGTTVSKVYGGLSVMGGTQAAQITGSAGIAGQRGGGGSGADTTASGKGGDGVVRIEYILGS